MLLLYRCHLVKDYKLWKKFFDKDEKRRWSFEVKTKRLMGSTDNDNEVHFVFEVKDLMKEAGVLEKPVMNVLEEI